jgi:hypothetical protein
VALRVAVGVEVLDGHLPILVDLGAEAGTKTAEIT